MTEPLLVSVAEAARILGTGKEFVYGLVHTRQLPHVKVGRTFKVPRVALDRYVEDLAGGRS